MSWIRNPLRSSLQRLRERATDRVTLSENDESARPLGFVRAWFLSRNYGDLLLASPALLAALILVIAAIVAVSPRKTESADTYVQWAATARQQGQNRLMELYLRKSARLSSAESQAIQFRNAQAMHNAGQVDDGISGMRRLAPFDARGYLPAHEWLIAQYAEQLSKNLQIQHPTETERNERESLLSLIESHCHQVLKHNPNHVNANDRLTMISLSRGDLSAAIEYLARIVAFNENARVTYAGLLVRQGQADEAKRQARLAVKFHSEALTRNTNEPTWIEYHLARLAESYVYLQKFQEATETLLVNGKAPESPALKKVLAQVMIAWSDHEPGDTPASAVKKMDLLEYALRLFPNHPELIFRIGALSELEGEAGDRAQHTLKSILATGHASWIAHFALGTRAYQAKDYRSAETHLEQAYRINPDILTTMNNLAYLIAHRETPDLQRALDLINKVIKIDPENAEYRDTRGAIYLQMERWSDAITDLEVSLKRLPGRPETHQALAKAYEAKGDAELAGIHRDAAKKLMKQP